MNDTNLWTKFASLSVAAEPLGMYGVKEKPAFSINRCSNVLRYLAEWLIPFSSRPNLQSYDWRSNAIAGLSV